MIHLAPEIHIITITIITSHTDSHLHVSLYSVNALTGTMTRVPSMAAEAGRIKVHIYLILYK